MNQMNQMIQNNNINQMNNSNLINQMNNMNNINNMNNMNYINNINLYNHLNQNNAINKRKVNDQMNLMRKIEQIIQMNPILSNQDKEIIFQLYQLYENINSVNHILGVSKFEDKFPEIKKAEIIEPKIKEPKNCIYFIRNNDNKRFGILISYSLKSNELYSIAERYKKYLYSDLKLFYKNKYLRKDETPIGHISFGDEINIVEELQDINDIDLTYYQSYLSKNNKKEKINIIFRFPSGYKKSMLFTSETTVKEMIKMFFFEIGLLPEKTENNFYLLYDAQHLDFNDNSSLSKLFSYSNISIFVIENK